MSEGPQYCLGFPFIALCNCLLGLPFKEFSPATNCQALVASENLGQSSRTSYDHCILYARKNNTICKMIQVSVVRGIVVGPFSTTDLMATSLGGCPWAGNLFSDLLISGSLHPYPQCDCTSQFPVQVPRATWLSVRWQVKWKWSSLKFETYTPSWSWSYHFVHVYQFGQRSKVVLQPISERCHQEKEKSKVGFWNQA